jgi:hypothetical protein
MRALLFRNRRFALVGACLLFAGFVAAAGYQAANGSWGFLLFGVGAAVGLLAGLLTDLALGVEAEELTEKEIEVSDPLYTLRQRRAA